MADQIANLGALRSVKCNATGSQVSILISQVNGQHTTSLFWKQFTMFMRADTDIYYRCHQCFMPIFSILKYFVWKCLLTDLYVTLPLRLMDDLITKCTFMMLRWTLWHTLTSSLADRPVVSHSQKKVKGKWGCFTVFLYSSNVEASPLVVLHCTCVLCVSGSSFRGRSLAVAAQYLTSGMRVNPVFLFARQCRSALNPHPPVSWTR